MMQISLQLHTYALRLNIDNDGVRRVLEKHYRPGPDSGHGPSWLTFIGHLKDSLWSVNLFRCDSILLKTHRVLVVMDRNAAHHWLWRAYR
jgi:hypothetical protein